jgi:ankyrin repeat protein
MKSNPDYTDIGPEFDHLKNMMEILLNEDLVRFVEKACSSLQSRRGLKRRDCYKRSLLHYAAMGNCTNLLLYILQTERNNVIESRDMWGRTPLSWAAQYGSLTVTKILLEQGANVNARDYEGGTPWTWLVHAGDSTSKSLPATEAYLRETGAKEV